MVADEVRKLATHSNDFNARIASQIRAAKHSIAETHDIVAEIASKDMSRAIMSKGRVDGMLSELAGFNADLEHTLTKVTHLTENMSTQVATAIRSLQFEDIVRQVLDHAHHHLDHLAHLTVLIRGRISELACQPAIDTEALAQSLASVCAAALGTKAELDTDRHKPAQQEDMAAGEIELF